MKTLSPLSLLLAWFYMDLQTGNDLLKLEKHHPAAIHRSVFAILIPDLLQVTSFLL